MMVKFARPGSIAARPGGRTVKRARREGCDLVSAALSANPAKPRNVFQVSPSTVS